jgi:hypothetical protein
MIATLGAAPGLKDAFAPTPKIKHSGRGSGGGRASLSVHPTCSPDTYELLNNCEKHNVHRLKKQPFGAVRFIKRGVYAKWTGNYLNHRGSLVKLCRSWFVLSAYFAWR